MLWRARSTRRAFVHGAGVAGLGLLASCSRPGGPVTPGKVYRIGYLSAQTLAASEPRVQALRQGLQELGWIEGQSFTIDMHLGEGQIDQVAGLAAELVRLAPDLVVTHGEPAARAMTNATKAIPIVFAAHADPVGTRLVESLAHPGGNATGVSEMAPELAGKRLELLKECVTTLTHLGAIYNASDPAMVHEYGETLIGAQAGGVDVLNLAVRSPDDVDRAYQTAVETRVDGLVVIVDPLLVRSRDRLVELSSRTGIPTISGDVAFAAAGGLMAYGPNIIRQTQRAAYYVDRILKGAKPADLPVEQPMFFDLIINVRTAQALGLTIPQYVLLQATEIIQ